MTDGFVQFSYHGWHQELVKRRITPRDVRWASDLMAGLTERQWADAFRAGGYQPDDDGRFGGMPRRSSSPAASARDDDQRRNRSF